RPDRWSSEARGRFWRNDAYDTPVMHSWKHTFSGAEMPETASIPVAGLGLGRTEPGNSVRGYTARSRPGAWRGGRFNRIVIKRRVSHALGAAGAPRGTGEVGS